MLETYSNKNIYIISSHKLLSDQKSTIILGDFLVHLLFLTEKEKSLKRIYCNFSDRKSR